MTAWDDIGLYVVTGLLQIAIVAVGIYQLVSDPRKKMDKPKHPVLPYEQRMELTHTAADKAARIVVGILLASFSLLAWTIWFVFFR